MRFNEEAMLDEVFERLDEMTELLKPGKVLAFEHKEYRWTLAKLEQVPKVLARFQKLPGVGDEEKVKKSYDIKKSYADGENPERRRVPDSLNVGQVVTGVVKNVKQPYGVFVNLGECDGLLHRSSMRLETTQLPSELFEVGDEIEVLVLKIDRERNLVSLASNEAYAGVVKVGRRKVPDSLCVGQSVTGEVTNVDQPYGVFVNLGECDGLLHRSQMPLERSQRPSDLCKVGDEVELVVLTIDRETNGVTLRYRSVQ